MLSRSQNFHFDEIREFFIFGLYDCMRYQHKRYCFVSSKSLDRLTMTSNFIHVVSRTFIGANCFTETFNTISNIRQ